MQPPDPFHTVAIQKPASGVSAWASARKDPCVHSRLGGLLAHSEGGGPQSTRARAINDGRRNAEIDAIDKLTNVVNDMLHPVAEQGRPPYAFFQVGHNGRSARCGKGTAGSPTYAARNAEEGTKSLGGPCHGMAVRAASKHTLPKTESTRPTCAG